MARNGVDAKGGDGVKCLSLWQPWATLMALGAKTVETRSWSTTYRGLLAIHAAKMWSTELHAIACGEVFWRALCGDTGVLGAANGLVNLPNELTKYGGGCLPFGAVVAVVDLDDCRDVGHLNPGKVEREFGDYSPGRFGWVTSNPRMLRRPVALNGRQGLFGLPDDVAEELMEEARISEHAS